MHVENFDHIGEGDELKFVVNDREDFDFAVDVITRYDLVSRCPLLISPVHGVLSPRSVAEWILESRLPLRLQLQVHKVLWPSAMRGV